MKRIWENAIVKCIWVFLILGLVSTFVSSVPYTLQTIDLVVSWSFSFIIALGGYINLKSPNAMALFIATFFLNNLLFAGIFHCLSHVFVGWLWMVPFIVIYLLVWRFPWINSSVSRKIRDEFYNPKTTIGKIFYGSGVFLLGGGSALFVRFGMMTNEYHREDIFVMVMGIMFTLITFVFAFTSSYDIWKKFQQQCKKKSDHSGVENGLLNG